MKEERLIAIEIKTDKINLESKLKDLLKGKKIYFNPDVAMLFGVEIEDWGRNLMIAIYNPKFNIVPDDQRIPRYDIETAKKEFPFLFRKV